MGQQQGRRDGEKEANKKKRAKTHQTLKSTIRSLTPHGCGQVSVVYSFLYMVRCAYYFLLLTISSAYGESTGDS